MPAKGAWRDFGRLRQTAAPLRHSTTEGSVCPQIPIAAPSPLATKNVQLSIECLAPWHLALRSCGDRVCLSLQSVVCQETGVARKPGRASHKPLKPKRRNNHVQHHASHEQRCNATTLTDLRHGAFCARAQAGCRLPPSLASPGPTLARCPSVNWVAHSVQGSKTVVTCTSLFRESGWGY